MAGSKADTWENGLLLLLFNNTTFTLVGDAAGLLKSAADGSLYVSLHTTDPGETGDQTTGECAYTGYARVAVARTSGGWTISGSTVTNAAAVTFGLDTVGSETANYFGVGATASSGAGKLLYSGSLTSPLAISPGITPAFAIGAISISEG